jgi:hypothetical protein
MVFCQAPELIFSAADRHRLVTVATGRVSAQADSCDYLDLATIYGFHIRGIDKESFHNLIKVSFFFSVYGGKKRVPFFCILRNYNFYIQIKFLK